MKNLIKVFGLIALVAIIGFSFAACSDGGGGGGGSGGGGGGGGGGSGTFTLTGIPEEYNGKYAIFYGENVPNVYGGHIYGCQTFYTTPDKLCLISNGSVSMPMWYQETSTSNGKRFSGNVNIMAGAANVDIKDGQTSWSSYITARYFSSSVSFVNGSATKSWSDGF